METHHQPHHQPHAHPQHSMQQGQPARLDYLDAVRAFALLLGIVFHASLSFVPIFIGWAVMDISTSSLVLLFITISHSFRMELFFLIAGFFGHMSFHRGGMKAFLTSRFTRIVLPFVAGWWILRPLIVSGWIMGGASMRGSVDILAGLKGGFQSLQNLPSELFTGTHLWFLYYMILTTVLVLLVRQILTFNATAYKRLGDLSDRTIRWLAGSWASFFLLALPVALLIANMHEWGMDTPDKSLVPHLPALAVFSGFFSFGWLLHRQRDLISQFARPSILKMVTLIASIAGTLYCSRFQFQSSHEYYQLARIAYVYSYALMMISLIGFTIGLFKTFCHKPNRIIRYLADSSYWLYLVHLPLVVWLQTAFAELPMHWSLKLACISMLTVGISLLAYDLFVRSTIIGKILNGRKRERVLFTTTRAGGQESNLTKPQQELI